jgi:hypothetical protein
MEVQEIFEERLTFLSFSLRLPVRAQTNQARLYALLKRCLNKKGLSLIFFIHFTNPPISEGRK